MIDATLDQTPSEDSELLRRYAEDGSQAAFAELVRRRIDLVYSVALRQTHGDRHRAEDATQAVFADLARKAASLARRPVLAGWLYRSAQFAATDLVRAEARRGARERIAHTMQIDLAPERSPADWEKVRPVLDEALSEMDEADRDAIVLRFFDQRPFADIGTLLRLSENAARMRVERALDKLAALLSRRGITSTAAALGTVIGAQIATAAPSGLAASVVSAALVPAAAGGSLVGILTLGKFQLGLAATMVVGGGAMLAHQTKANDELRHEISTTRPEASALARFRSENLSLVARIAEAESLQREVADIASLERGVTEAGQALARRQAAATPRPAPNELLQAQIQRLNKEGNELVKNYKAISVRVNDSAVAPADRARAAEAAQQTLAAIKAKQTAIKELVATSQGQVSDPTGRFTLNSDPADSAGAAPPTEASMEGQIRFTKPTP